MKFKNGEITTDSEEVQSFLEKQRDITIWEKYQIELVALEKLIDNRLERMKRLFKIYPTNPLIKSNVKLFTKQNMDRDIESKIEKFKSEINTLIKQLQEKCK